MDLLLLCYQPNAEFPLSSFFFPLPFSISKKGQKEAVLGGREAMEVLDDPGIAKVGTEICYQCL